MSFLVFEPGTSARYPTRCGYSTVDLGGAYGTLLPCQGNTNFTVVEAYYDSAADTFNVTIGAAGVPVTASLLEVNTAQVFSGAQETPIGTFYTQFGSDTVGLGKVNPEGSTFTAATELGGGFVRYSWPGVGIATGPNTAPAALISMSVSQYAVSVN